MTTNDKAPGQAPATEQPQGLVVDRLQGPASGSSRRGFVLAGVAGLCALAGVLFLGSPGRFGRPATPLQRNTKPMRVPRSGLRFDATGVAGPLSYGSGDSTVGIFIVEHGSGMIALEQTCTHQGCPVAWHAGAQRFECPCHGSAFDINGTVVASPATAALYRHHLMVEKDAVIIGGRV